jgi:beta-glucosidase
VYYNHFPSKGDEYVDGDDTPQFPFGHGLSYATFKYDQLAVTPPNVGSQDDVLVTFEVTNSGSLAGDEVAQLYARKKTATVATPVLALKGFSRIHLAPGETKLVSLTLKQADLAIWGADRQWKVEPGEYEVTVGGSSVGVLSAKFVLETLQQTAGE